MRARSHVVVVVEVAVSRSVSARSEWESERALLVPKRASVCVSCVQRQANQLAAASHHPVQNIRCTCGRRGDRRRQHANRTKVMRRRTRARRERSVRHHHYQQHTRAAAPGAGARANRVGCKHVQTSLTHHRAIGDDARIVSQLCVSPCCCARGKRAAAVDAIETRAGVADASSRRVRMLETCKRRERKGQLAPSLLRTSAHLRSKREGVCHEPGALEKVLSQTLLRSMEETQAQSTKMSKVVAMLSKGSGKEDAVVVVGSLWSSSRALSIHTYTLALSHVLIHTRRLSRSSSHRLNRDLLG